MTGSSPHFDTFINAEELQALHTHLAEALKPHLAATHLANNELTLTAAAQNLIPVLTHLRDNPLCKFTQLMSVTGVDYLGYPVQQPARFAAVYHLLSLELNQRVRVKVYLNENQPVPTATTLFASAGWYERETYDMYGIVFENHSDLRRILTDYDFTGFPLRKDFPLEGHVEVYYDAAEQRVAYKPVDLPQEFRHFDRISEWQGMTGNAPLAEQDQPFSKEEFK